MAISYLGTGVALDDDLEDGYIRVEDEGGREPTFFMNWPTYCALGGLHNQLREALDGVPDGVYLVPRRVIEPAAAADLELAIVHAEEHGDGCTMPGCLQDVVDTSRGYPLCAIHDELMRDRDRLVLARHPSEPAPDDRDADDQDADDSST